jgi:hypothetical protein
MHIVQLIDEIYDKYYICTYIALASRAEVFCIM